MKAFVDIDEAIKETVVTLKVRGLRAFKWKLQILRWLLLVAIRIMGLSGKIGVALVDQGGDLNGERGV